MTRIIMLCPIQENLADFFLFVGYDDAPGYFYSESLKKYPEGRSRSILTFTSASLIANGNNASLEGREKAKM